MKKNLSHAMKRSRLSNLKRKQVSFIEKSDSFWVLGSFFGRERLCGSRVGRGLGRVATVARRCYLLLPWMRVVALKLVLVANFLGGEKASLLVTSRMLRLVTSRLLLVATSRLMQIQMATTLWWLSWLVNSSSTPCLPLGQAAETTAGNTGKGCKDKSYDTNLSNKS